MHQCDSHNPHLSNTRPTHYFWNSNELGVKLSPDMFLISRFAHMRTRVRIASMFDLLSGIFTKSLSLCFFSCSISLSPSLVSNWVSLIYSPTMLAWPSLCWPCKKISGGLSNRHCSGYPHTHTYTPSIPHTSSEWLCQWAGSESTCRSSGPHSRTID